jgi:hypothetical protein
MSNIKTIAATIADVIAPYMGNAEGLQYEGVDAVVKEVTQALIDREQDITDQLRLVAAREHLQPNLVDQAFRECGLGVVVAAVPDRMTQAAIGEAIAGLQDQINELKRQFGG